MYNNNFVAVIKSNGRVLSDTNGRVKLPFGSQYSILLKNLDSRKALVKISIDGDDVCDGNRIIVSADSFIEIKGKIEGNKVRHKFKFIERTEDISNYRGNNIEDGLIRIEYWFEEKAIEQVYSNYCWSYKTNYKPLYSSCSAIDSNSSVNSVGITVQGGHTKQDFVSASTNALEDTYSVIVICLIGEENGSKIDKAVSVKTKLKCPICGRKSKYNAKWCYNCGTNLE
jgi:hypothetical protein